MKKFVVQVIILLIIIFTALILYTNKGIDLPLLPQSTTKAEVVIGSAKIEVEVADTSSKRNQGLGGRASLGSNSGMLFTFEEPRSPAFWMKGVGFPIDIIWIRQDKIVDLTTNVPPPAAGASDQELPQYIPDQPVDKVLEVNAGFVSQHNINVGDTVVVNRIGTNVINVR